jgi:hypothetical protein
MKTMLKHGGAHIRIALVVALCLMTTAMNSKRSHAAGNGYKSQQVIVRLKGGANIKQVNETYGTTTLKSLRLVGGS